MRNDIFTRFFFTAASFIIAKTGNNSVTLVDRGLVTQIMVYNGVP